MKENRIAGHGRPVQSLTETEREPTLIATADPKFVGIDLGTTYSSLNYLDENQKSVPVPDREGEFLTPSVVYFADTGMEHLVGKPAVLAGMTRPERVVKHAKRYLGDPNKVWECDGVVYTPVDVLALIVRKLLRDAEPTTGPVRDAVITVPAHYTGHQRMLTIQAGKQAGLESVNVVNEPVSAALSYVLADVVLGEGAQVVNFLEDETTILIFDLGGGTFDLSIVKYNSDQLRVIGASGDEQLGGIDWDQQLVDLIAEQVLDDHPDLVDDMIAVARLERAVEQAKFALTQEASAEVLVEGNGWQKHVSITRHEFEERTKGLVERALDRTLSLMRSCGLEKKDIDCLLPVGGASQMPMIRNMLDRKLGWTTNFIRDVSPVMSISKGAALFAGMISSNSFPAGTGMVAQRLARYSTSNVSTHSLGLLARDDRGQRFTHVLIPNNTPLPASTSLKVRTVRPNQKRVSVRVVEGSQDKGELVCRCSIDDLPDGLPARSIIHVHVTYDADGLLSVVAKHDETGRLASVSAQYTA